MVTVYSTSDIRMHKFCMLHQLYTMGDNEAFQNMLAVAEMFWHRPPDELMVIAQDIIDHSDPENEIIKMIEADLYEDETPALRLMYDMVREGAVSIWWEESMI